MRVPLEQLADPTDTSYIPRPEWYFLFLFQTLKLFKGPLEVVGSVVLPGLAVLALILVPFIDRGAMIKVTRRTFAVAVVVLGRDRMGRTDHWPLSMTTPKGQAQIAIDYSEPTDWMQLSPEEMAGHWVFSRGKRAAVVTPLLKAAPESAPILTRTAIIARGLDDSAF